MGAPAHPTILSNYRRRRDAWMNRAREAARWRDLLLALGDHQLAQQQAREVAGYVRLARHNHRALVRAQLGKAVPTIATGGRYHERS